MVRPRSSQESITHARGPLVRLIMEDKLKLLISQLGKNRVKRDIDLTDHLQTKLGGKASVFYIATTSRELVNVVELCRELQINYLVIGSGSKVVISEGGFLGVVVKNRSDNLKIFGIKGKVSRDGLGVEEALIEAESGASLKKVADYISAQGLGGLEGIENTPGTIGGNFYINSILQEKTKQLRALNSAGFQKLKLPKEVSREDLILSVIFRLKAKR